METFFWDAEKDISWNRIQLQTRILNVFDQPQEKNRCLKCKKERKDAGNWGICIEEITEEFMQSYGLDTKLSEKLNQHTRAINKQAKEIALLKKII